MKRDRGWETHCAWISVFVERVFLFSIVWSGLLSFRWTFNVMLSEHLLSGIRILQRPVQNEDKHWITGRLWDSTKSSWILLSTFYWYFIRNKDQRPKVCKLNSTVNIKEKLKVTRAPHASVTPEPKCLRIIQQPAKLANRFQADCSRWPFFCSALKAWKMCLHSKAIKVHRQMLQQKGWMVQSQWSRFVLDWDSWMGHECNTGDVEDMITDSPEWWKPTWPTFTKTHTRNKKDTISSKVLNMDAGSWWFFYCMGSPSQITTNHCLIWSPWPWSGCTVPAPSDAGPKS